MISLSNGDENSAQENLTQEGEDRPGLNAGHNQRKQRFQKREKNHA
jgi:hypothetical protein